MTITLTIHRQDQFSSVWIKGIRAVDLNEHCLDSLIGQRYGKAELRKAARTSTITVELAPGEVALYVCGVTYPYRWADNAHLALMPREGAQWHGDAMTPGMKITVLGAEPVFGWGEKDVNPAHPSYSDRLYRTCRNLQFAWWLHNNHGVFDERNPERDAFKKAKKKAPREQGLFRIFGVLARLRAH